MTLFGSERRRAMGMPHEVLVPRPQVWDASDWLIEEAELADWAYMGSTLLDYRRRMGIFRFRDSTLAVMFKLKWA